MTPARTIAQRLLQTELPDSTGPGAIYAIAADEHNVHFLGESELDTWWQGLSPEEKGEIYERDLNGESPLPPASPEFQQIVAGIRANFEELRRRPFHLPAHREELTHG